MPVIPPIMSAAAFASVAFALLVWLVVAAVGVGWMVVRLVRSQAAHVWDWVVWLVATVLVGPLAPLIHRQVVRGRCKTVCAALLPIGGYAVAWALAVLAIMRVGGEPHPAVILGGTVVLPVVTGLVLVRAPMLRRAGAGSYVAGLRRGALVEIITWSAAFAVFLPLTFLVDEFLLSTVPPPSSPFFGAIMSVAALVTLAVLMGLNRMLEWRGFSTWPAAATVTGITGTLELPKFRTAWWILLAGLALVATALVVTITLVG
jgi:hypothetical protein